MNKFKIGQEVWIVAPGMSKRAKELVSFFNVTIKEIVTVRNHEGQTVRFCLSNGDKVWENDLFTSKNAAIDYVIRILEGEKE